VPDGHAGENAIAELLFGAAAVSSMAGPRDDTTLISAPPKTELAAGDESIMVLPITFLCARHASDMGLGPKSA
jgi:hypothetical protein